MAMAKDASGEDLLVQLNNDDWTSEVSSSDRGSSDEEEEDWQSCKRCHYQEERTFRLYAGSGSELTYEGVKETLSELGFDTALQEMMRTTDWYEFLRACDLDNTNKIGWMEFQKIVSHLLVTEATQFAKGARAVMGTLRTKLLRGEPDVTGEVDQLTTLWKSATPRRLLRWFQAMDSKAAHEARISMLESLAFIVPLRDAKAKWLPGLGNKHLISFGKFHGDQIAGQNSVVVMESHFGLPLPLSSRSQSSMHKLGFEKNWKWWRNMTYAQRGEEKNYKLAYTTIEIFHSRLFVNLVRAIEIATVESGVYNTPIVNAILQVGWKRAKAAFFFNMLGDAILVLALCIAAYDSRLELKPSGLVLWTGFLLSMFHFMSDSWELFWPVYAVWKHHRMVWEDSKDRTCSSMHVVLSSVYIGMSHLIGSFWSLYGMVASAFLFGVLSMAILTKPKLFFDVGFFSSDEGMHWLQNHPTLIEFLIFIKGTHIIIKLMCMRPLGECIMPAYAALKHKSSVGLLFMLFLFYCNAVITYHALPIQVYSPDEERKNPWDPWENLFQTAILLFRVTFLGELDPHQLAGRNLRVRFNITEEGGAGHILPPAGLPSYHHGVQVISLAFVILIHVMLLNVYIGVLSQQYSQFEPRERELFEKFRAIFTRRTLFRYNWCIRRLKKRCTRDRVRGRHTWIAFESSLFTDPLERERCGGSETPMLKRQEMDGIRLLRIVQKLLPTLAASMHFSRAEGTLYECGLPVAQVVPKENFKDSLLFWDAKWFREHSRDADSIRAEFEAGAAAE